MANIKTDMQNLIERASFIANKDKSMHDEIMKLTCKNLGKVFFILDALGMNEVKVYFNDKEYIMLVDNQVAFGDDLLGVHVKSSIESLELSVSRLIDINIALICYTEELTIREKAKRSTIESMLNQEKDSNTT